MTSRFVRVFEGSMIVLILAAIAMGVTPRISQAQSERKVSVLADHLQRIRSRIAVFQVDHNGQMPGATAGQLNSQAFVAALTEQDEQGMGPYLDQIPANPFILDAECQRTVTVVYDPAARPTGREGTAWWFNAATGHFAACDSVYHAAY